MKVIDGTNMVYGRLSSLVAKELLNGEEIVVVNSDKVAVTGRRGFTIQKFKERLDIGSVRKGPYYPRTSNQILRRSIGDMLPKKTTHGKEALRRCKVYPGLPKEFSTASVVVLEKARNNKVSGFVTLGEIAKNIGGKY
ncbi:MAG TPA: 50S ribosomal protein L13 [Thermoplasmataceae archaeon]|nr:50S ribosomal protein L13 [Thermoplasmatales archaeon AK]HLH86264.1 50S ribosomal protein L13 [Thermoplasmataceae archaeon]